MTENKVPMPLYILQNSGPITKSLFSLFNKELIYVCNRNGDLNVYDLNLRRSVFNGNANKESILGIVELSETCVLTHARNGIIHKWTRNQMEWTFQSIVVFQRRFYPNTIFKYI